MISHVGFSIWGFGFGVQGSVLRDCDVIVGAQDLGFGGSGLMSMVWGLGCKSGSGGFGV